MKFDNFLKNGDTKTEVLSESNGFINLVALARRFPEDPSYLASLMATAVSIGDMRQAKHIEAMIRSIKDNKNKSE